MKRVLYVLKLVALAFAAAVVMTILAAFPPLSILYDWLVGHGLRSMWVGLVAGVISLCLGLYEAHRTKKK